MQQHDIIPQPQLMEAARQDLSGNWGTSVGLTVIFLLVSTFAGIIPFGSLIISGPLSLGLVTYYLDLTRNGNADLGKLFDGFNNFGNALLVYLLMFIAITIGLLFFIIPGIILSLGWSQTYYILHDDPNIGAIEALKKSWKMMEGFKADIFVLGLRFLLWIILSVFTLFIGLLWLIPYMYTTFAKFYDQIKYVNFPEDAQDSNDDYASHLVDF